MATLKTWVDIGLKGNLQEQSRKNAEAMERFGQRSKGALAGVGAGLENWAKSLGAVAAGYLSINSAMQLIQKIGDFEERVVRLKQAGNMTKEEVVTLISEIRKVASDPSISIDDTKVLEAVERVVADIGYSDLIKSNLRNIAISAQASGGSGENIGGMLSQAPKMGITSSDDVAEMMDTLREQGKYAAFPAKELAEFGPQIFSSAIAANMKGLQGIRDAGALLQTAMAAKGVPAEAKTGFVNLMRDMVTNRKEIKKLGVQLFDPEMLKQGKEVYRPIDQVLGDILKKSGGRISKLQKVFQGESLPVIQYLNTEEGWKLFQNLRTIKSSGEMMTKDAAELAQTANAKKARAANRGMEVADARGRGLVNDISDAQARWTEDFMRWQTGKSWPVAVVKAPFDYISYAIENAGAGAFDAYQENIGRPFARLFTRAPAAAPPVPADPQRVAVDIKVNQDGRVKEVKVKGAGDGSAQIMRGTRVPQ